MTDFEVIRTISKNLTALIQETYPSGRVVKNEFEPDGDLAKVISKQNGTRIYQPYASGFSYTASGGISQMRLGNGKWETAKFNTRLQVYELGLGTSETDTSLWRVNYEYGELQDNGNVDTSKNTGNIAKQILNIPGTNFVQAYKYDSLYRLTEAKETTGATQNWMQQFGYDRYGNRTSFNQVIGSTQTNTTPSINADTNRFSNLRCGTWERLDQTVLIASEALCDKQGRNRLFQPEEFFDRAHHAFV